LEKVAPQTPHMKIGTIDCTVEKTLCNRFNVRGYPTLKYSIDGEVIDYPGGRGEGDFTSFARRMEGPAISLVPSLSAALAEASDGVAFIAYHPAAVTAFNLDGKIASSRLTQVFGQAARKLQASGTFTLLDTSHAESDEEAAAIASALGEGPYICRLENEVKPRCYYKISDSMTADPLKEWIARENVPTVSTVGASNFNKLSKKGKPLCLAIVKKDAAEATSILKKYAIGVPSAENYIFATVDGVQWKRFIDQFGVKIADLPQLLLLDSPKKLYWHNATYNLDVERFLRDVESGVIEKKYSGKGGAKGFLQNLLETLNKYEPYSSIAFLCTIILILVGSVYMCCFRSTKAPSSKQDDNKSQAETETKKDK
jgi:hypothetical protein